jgi:hypothetical protein
MQAPAETQLVRGHHHTDGGARHQRHIGEVREWRAQRDHLLDALGPSLRQHLCQQPASAVPDQRHRRAVVFLNLSHPVAETRKHGLRVKDVEIDAGEVRPVSDPPKPPMHEAHRPVPG